MAAKKPTAYEPETTYSVQVSRPVKAGPFKYLPRDNPKMTGAQLNRIVEENGADAIRTAERV